MFVKCASLPFTGEVKLRAGKPGGGEVVEGRWRVLFAFVEPKGHGIVQVRVPNGERIFGFGTQESVQSQRWDSGKGVKSEGWWYRVTQEVVGGHSMVQASGRKT